MRLEGKGRSGSVDAGGGGSIAGTARTVAVDQRTSGAATQETSGAGRRGAAHEEPCVTEPAALEEDPSPATDKPPRRSRAESREAAIDRIVDIATQEFVEKGLAGARIDEIAGHTTKRKIYYYFGSKDELYRAVLERAYRRVRESEDQVDIVSGSAADALRRLIEHDVRYHARHPELVRLVMNENIHHAEHLKQIEGVTTGNRRVIDLVARILARGEAEGVFRPGIDAVELHMNMTALAFYNVSNQFTFAHNFGVDMTSPAAVERRARQVSDIILAWVTRPA